MAILVRKGTVDKFDKNKLLPGELAIVTNGSTYGNGSMFFCASAGNVKEVATKEDLQTILNSSGEAYDALIALISELQSNTALSAIILTDLNYLKSNNCGRDYPENTYANQFYKLIV